ncbi:unnamed protein product, partial [[Candida] boidinii]
MSLTSDRFYSHDAFSNIGSAPPPPLPNSGDSNNNDSNHNQQQHQQQQGQGQGPPQSIHSKNSSNGSSTLSLSNNINNLNLNTGNGNGTGSGSNYTTSNVTTPISNHPNSISSSNSLALQPLEPTNTKIHTTIHRKNGWVHVKDEGLISFRWPKKYLILTETSLDFFKNDDKIELSFSIPLLHINKCIKNQMRTHCFEIVHRSKSTFVAVKTETELYMWIDSILAKCPRDGFSRPINFKHETHVHYDPSNGNYSGFGISNELNNMLENSNINNEDIARDPQAVVD